MGGNFGFSFSWKRALGISSAKGKISRALGIPLTKSGRQRKAGKILGDFASTTLIAGAPHPTSHDEQSDALNETRAAVASLRRDLLQPNKSIGLDTLVYQVDKGRMFPMQCQTCQLAYHNNMTHCERCGAPLIRS